LEILKIFKILDIQLDLGFGISYVTYYYDAIQTSNDILKYESFLSAFEGEKGLISNL
jgi:hypothetical protein